MTEVEVYFRFGPAYAMVGPLKSYELGDMVQVPPRGPKMGDGGMPGFIGTVQRIEEDGMAVVMPPPPGPQAEHDHVGQTLAPPTTPDDF